MTEFVLRLIHPDDGDVVATGNPKMAADIAVAAVQSRMRLAEYLMRADIEAFQGRGEAEFTGKLKKAKRFPTHEAAFEYWRKQSLTRPYRADGKPNRPLTAFNVTIEKVES